MKSDQPMKSSTHGPWLSQVGTVASSISSFHLIVAPLFRPYFALCTLLQFYFLLRWAFFNHSFRKMKKPINSIATSSKTHFEESEEEEEIESSSEGEKADDTIDSDEVGIFTVGIFKMSYVFMQ